MTVQSEILQVARAELGVAEDPPGSNTGRRVRDYQAQDWLPGTGYPWCVSFAWCWVVWHRVLKRPCPYPTASVSQLAGWARKNGWAIGVAQIRPGDLVCLGGGRHVTIVNSIPKGGRFDGLGGNQSDAVRITSYPLSDVTCVIRVPARPGGQPAAKPPLWEIVRGDGERRQIVWAGKTRRRALEVAARQLDRGRRVITIRRQRR